MRPLARAATRSRLALAAASLCIAACGGGGDGGGTTNPPPPAGSFSLSAAPVTIQAGQSGTSAITIGRTNFTGAVTLTATAPAGLTVAFDNSAPTGGAATATVTVAAATAAGNYTVTINGTGTGVTAQTTTIAVTVTPAPPPASIALALAPNPLTVQAGQSGNATVTLTRTNFAGAVTIAATAPAGLTATVTGSPTTTNTASVAIAAAAGTAAGNYTVTITATGTGVTQQTAQLAVTVTAAPPPGGVTLAIAPSPVTVTQGQTSAPVTATITRTNNFTGPVSIAVEGLPAGMTATPQQQTIAANATTATFTLTAAASTNVGLAGYAVRAFDANNPNYAIQNAQVNITAAPPAGFTATLTPNPLSIVAGQTGTLTATFTRTNFTGAITATATATGGLGVTVTGSPTNGNTVGLTVTVPGGTAPGNYTVTLTATGPGVAQQTATATVAVSAGGGGGNASYTFCGGLPVWFAVQDGNGAWQRVTPNGNTFSFTISQSRGGVAYTFQSGTDFDTQVIFASRDEFLGVSSGCTERAPGTKTVNGTVTGFNPAQFQQATIALGSASDSPSDPGPFQLTGVEDGTVDLIATRSIFNLQTFSLTPDRLIIRRDLNPANNSTLPALDFNSPEAFAPASATLTIGNVGSDTSFAFVSYATRNGEGAAFFTGIPAAGGTRTIYGVPANRQAAGELHSIGIIAASSTQSLAANFRALFTYVGALTDRTVTLGGGLQLPNVTAVAGGANGRLRFTGTLAAPYTSVLTAQASQANGNRGVTISATPAYLGGNAYDITIPDFTGVAGWQEAYGLARGTLAEWTFSAAGFNASGFDPRPVEGLTIQFAARVGTATP